MKMSYDYLREFYRYEPETGLFYRTHYIDNQGRKYERETIVKAISHSGYLVVTFKKKLVKVHHLIYLYMTGNYPDRYVDHIDGDRVNNKWSNLRLVHKVDNQRNQGVQQRNKTGRTGVYWYPPLNKYHAQITTCGKKHHLGYFSEFEDAVKARRKAEERLGFHINHGERPAWEK